MTACPSPHGGEKGLVMGEVSCRGVAGAGEGAKAPLERFWAFVPERPMEGCWLWWGAMTGRDDCNPVIKADGRNQSAARYLWTLLHGDPGATFVTRTCHTPRCVRPEHLCLTHGGCWQPYDRWGEANPGVKLSDRQVVVLRQLRQRGVKVAQLANYFGIHEGHVRAIYTGRARLAAGGPIREAA